MNEIIEILLANTETAEIRIGLWDEQLIESAIGVEDSVPTFYAEAYEFKEGYGSTLEAWQELAASLGAHSINEALMELAVQLIPKTKIEVWQELKNNIGE